MIYALIPARYQSTRLPGKPLEMISGKSMIQRTYEQAQKAQLVDDVIVATDDERIQQAVLAFGGKVIMTSSTHTSGTDRLAEIAKNNKDIDIIVNVQGDEPIISPECIDKAVKPLIDDHNIMMSTLIRKCEEQRDLENNNIVKVVFDRDDFAMYFSRSCIPFKRTAGLMDHYLHIGLYVYRRETLIQLSEMAPAPIEQTESLEQLRALYHGIKIKTVKTNYTPISVDVPDDIKKVEEFIRLNNL